MNMLVTYVFIVRNYFKMRYESGIKDKLHMLEKVLLRVV